MSASQVQDLSHTWSHIQAGSMTLDLPARPTVVLAPHPDDETLMSAGAIMTQVDRGVPVTILAATDGEAAYPGEVSPGRLAAIRRVEQRHAVGALGVEPSDLIRLDLGDGQLHDRQDELAEVLSTHVTADVLLIAPWDRDGHSDHDACGRVAEVVAAQCSAVLLSGLFWAWHRRGPEDLDGRDLHRLPLDAPMQRRRRAALSCHASQLEAEVATKPILTPDDLEPMEWAAEYYIATGAVR